MSLHLKPVTLAQANEFIIEHHRHLKTKRLKGCRFVTGALDGAGTLCGVIVVGRPRARMLQDGYTGEVRRLCVLEWVSGSDRASSWVGLRNACTLLLGAARKAARALGYRRLVTYTLPEEGGGSLRAAGWRLMRTGGGGEWSREDRPRDPAEVPQQKHFWEAW